jgi:DNA-binding response OmpR family regulator
MNEALCPTCGASIAHDADIKFDFELNVITGRGRIAMMSQHEMDVVEAVYSHFPNVVSRDRMMTRIYGHRPEEPDPKIVDVFICKARKKFKDMGFDIVNRWGRGYRLIYEGGEE